jgi:peptidoglycan/LPS O-acetylase OafA/YrhL
MGVSTNAKQHYELLDGLRGIAALVVVIFHFTEYLYPDYHLNPFGHGFLAVDFFFCLSGFVIAYAYDDRAGKISYRDFFVKRLIRLHPMVVLGSVLGLLWYLFVPFSAHPEPLSYSMLALIFLMSLLMIPGAPFPNRWGNLMPLNSPAWSLFTEYVANIFYILVLWRLPRRWLTIIFILSTVIIIYNAFHVGNLMGGWSLGTIDEGLYRIFFSFMAGIMIHRFKLIIHSKLGFISLSILLVAGLVMPFPTWDWLAELLVVMIAWPLIISLGAGATISEGMRKFCSFLGRLSYPLYMTHYMVMFTFGYYYPQYPVKGFQLWSAIGIMTALLAGFAYLVLKYFDEPVRAYLTKKYDKKKIA